MKQNKWVITLTFEEWDIMYLAWQKPVAPDETGYFWTSKETMLECAKTYNTNEHPFMFTTGKNAIVYIHFLSIPVFKNGVIGIRQISLDDSIEITVQTDLDTDHRKTRNESGRIIHESDNTGWEKYYRYDDAGNRIFEKVFIDGIPSTERHYVYDRFRKLVFKEIISHNQHTKIWFNGTEPVYIHTEKKVGK